MHTAQTMSQDSQERAERAWNRIEQLSIDQLDKAATIIGWAIEDAVRDAVIEETHRNVENER